MNHLDETTIGLFLEHRLPDERARGMEHHMDACAACRRLVGELVRTSPRGEGSTDAPVAATRARGDRIGRYLVLDLVGAGAMGAVYAAFDPDLDRKVALKVLHAGADASDAERTRLLREAQALARVSHPNVVAVHDVGSVGEQIFIAMELVPGGTLTTWLAERPRSWREILAVAVAAGRGLEAAHAAGLVHRDVKPDNILVDPSGVARIGDFGLAAGSADAATRPGDPRVAASAPTFAAELTASGALLGTPAYMSPEQLAAEPATARSDQFSWCATCYEALYGVRPYPGTTIREVIEAMAAERLAEPDPRRVAEIPARLRAAIERGLSVDPERRHASMAELLAQLAHDRWPRRRIIAVAAAGALVVGAGGFAVATLAGTHPRPCTTSAAEIARAWSPERRAQVRAAIVATNLPFAGDSADRVDRALDAYAASWAVAHREACEATAVHRTQSPELLDRRMTCLDQRRFELDAAIDSLAASNHESVRHAVEVATRLPSLAGCGDPALLGAVAPRPTDPATLAEVASIERDLARARVLDHQALPRQAIEVARAAAARAERVGYAPLVGAAYFALGSAQVQVGPPKATRASLEHAIASATAGGDEATEALALANLAMVLRHDSPDGAVATNQIQQALAIVGRSKGDPLLEAEVHYAAIEVLAGIDQPAIEDHLKRARERLAAAARAGADTRRLELELEQVEAFLEVTAAGALAKLEVARKTAEQLYGTAHPQVAAVLVNMAHYALVDGRTDEARAHARRAAEILAPYPGNEVELRRIDASLEPDAAKRRPILEEVVRLSEAAYGPNSPQLASDHELCAETLLELEDYRAGLAHIDATIAIWESAYGGHYELMITSLVTKAQLLAGLEDWNGVAAAAERANAIVDHGGMREITKAMAKLLLVDVYFRQKRFAAALAMLESVTPLLGIVMAGDPAAALLDFYAAACHWELGRDRPAELRKARAALATFRTASKPDKDSLAFMTAWLAGK